MTTALKSAASGQPGPAAYSSRTVKGAARASRPDSASNDRRTAPAQTIRRGRGTITAATIPRLPRPAAAEHCVETGPRTRPRHDALRPRVQRLASDRTRNASRCSARCPFGKPARVLRDERQRDREVAARVRAMSALKQISSAVNGSPWRRRRAGCGGSGRFTFGVAGAGGSLDRAADARDGNIGAGGTLSGEATCGSCARSTVERGHRSDRGAGDRERRRERDPKQAATRAPAHRRRLRSGTARRRNHVARERSLARGRAPAPATREATCRWIFRGLRNASSSGSRSEPWRFISTTPPSATAERRRPALSVPCRASRRRRTS